MQQGEDNTMPRLVHAERPADSEARILEMAQALNIMSSEALEPGDQKPRQQGRVFSSMRICGFNPSTISSANLPSAYDLDFFKRFATEVGWRIPRFPTRDRRSQIDRLN